MFSIMSDYCSIGDCPLPEEQRTLDIDQAQAKSGNTQPDTLKDDLSPHPQILALNPT